MFCKRGGTEPGQVGPICLQCQTAQAEGSASNGHDVNRLYADCHAGGSTLCIRKRPAAIAKREYWIRQGT